MKQVTLTAENLKNAPWTTLEELRSKRISADVANAVAAQSREIVRVVRTEMAIAKHSTGKSGVTKKLLG